MTLVISNPLRTLLITRHQRIPYETDTNHRATKLTLCSVRDILGTHAINKSQSFSMYFISFVSLQYT